ncbi:hypothetical protein SDC9_159903 [bioreactor metagenome]|uniref:Uncharacterized protein n=1 Tax=bioreactor metagenome TaxID=1076179 RepID=A0A645FDV9_9ZZZZ
MLVILQGPLIHHQHQFRLRDNGRFHAVGDHHIAHGAAPPFFLAIKRGKGYLVTFFDDHVAQDLAQEHNALAADAGKQ